MLAVTIDVKGKMDFFSQYRALRYTPATGRIEYIILNTVKLVFVPLGD